MKLLLQLFKTQHIYTHYNVFCEKKVVTIFEFWFSKLYRALSYTETTIIHKIFETNSSYHGNSAPSTPEQGTRLGNSVLREKLNFGFQEIFTSIDKTFMS